MNNLPANLGRHTAFRDNTYTHTFVFPETYDLPTVDQIKMQIRVNGVVQPYEGSITVIGNRVKNVYSPEVLRQVQSGAQHYLVLSGQSVLGGALHVVVGYGEQEITETEVTINENDQFTVVQVSGMTLIAVLMQRMENLEAVNAALLTRITTLENLLV